MAQLMEHQGQATSQLAAAEGDRRARDGGSAVDLAAGHAGRSELQENGIAGVDPGAHRQRPRGSGFGHPERHLSGGGRGHERGRLLVDTQGHGVGADLRRGYDEDEALDNPGQGLSGGGAGRFRTVVDQPGGVLRVQPGRADFRPKAHEV